MQLSTGKQKLYNLKVASFDLFKDPTDDRDTASQMAQRNCPEEAGEEPGYLAVVTGKKKKEKTYVVGHQKMTANHQNQTSQVNDFSAFLYMGRCNSLGSSELIL